MPADGSSAAFGFSYQYLVSALYALRMLSANPARAADVALSIEPVAHVVATGKADDIIDFSLCLDGAEVERVQVKASTAPETHPLQPADAREVFDRLLATTGSGAASLLTNRPLSPMLHREVTPEPDVRTASEQSYRWNNAPTGGGSVDARIVVDLRPVGEIEAELEELIRGVRRDRALSQGLTSCRLLGPILRHRIFDAASGRAATTLSGADLLAQLHIPDPQIAHLAGGFDWGVPIAHVPSLASTVARLDILDRLTDAIELDPAARSPTIATVTGPTGTGKSTIAADYCHINYNRYEFICWIDSRDPDTAEAQVREALLRLTDSLVKPGADVAGPFCTALGRHRGPWLLVFDGAGGPAAIGKYLPSAGHGSVIVTTTNSTQWWPGAHRIDVEAFTPTEAIDCFARYADIPQHAIPGAEATIRAVIERLGRIPLAVSMAGVYFANTEGELDELVDDYFTTLEALEDTLSIPPGYDRTLYTAIQHAIDHLGPSLTSPYRREARDTLYLGSLFAPELIPLDVVIPAAILAETIEIDLADRPPVTAVPQPIARAVIALLRTQTIAHRVVHRDKRERLTPVSNTISVHPLVHEIIRDTFLKKLQPGGFQATAAALMHYLTAWVGQMRAQNEYFALEQLRVHAEYLLRLAADRITGLPVAAPDVERVFITARALLMIELSTCLAQAARYTRSIRVATEATALFATLNEPFANRLAALTLSDQAIDAALAAAEPERVAAPAELALPLLTDLTKSNVSSLREFAFERVGELAHELSRTPHYRGDARLNELAASLRALAVNNPDLESSAFMMVERMNEALARHRYRHVLDELLPHLRTDDLPAYTRLTLDCIEVFAHLGARNLQDAITGMDALLGIELEGAHLIHPLHQGFSKIRQILLASTQLPGAPAVLAQYHLRISKRLAELTRMMTELREQD